MPAQPLSKISAAFDKAVEAFNAANLVTGSGYSNQPMDLVFENQRYVPTVGRAYQEAFILPAQTQQPGQGVGGVRVYRGIYQVTLNYPRDEGRGGAAGRADLLCAAFARGALVSYSGVSPTIEREPSVSPARITDDWFIVVVSIPYFIFS